MFPRKNLCFHRFHFSSKVKIVIGRKVFRNYCLFCLLFTMGPARKVDDFIVYFVYIHFDWSKSSKIFVYFVYKLCENFSRKHFAIVGFVPKGPCENALLDLRQRMNIYSIRGGPTAIRGLNFQANRQHAILSYAILSLSFYAILSCVSVQLLAEKSAHFYVFLCAKIFVCRGNSVL